MLIDDKQLYLLADQRFYEPLERAPVDPTDFYDAVRATIPEDWLLERRELWFDCYHEDSRSPDHGWKIHLSATLGTAPMIVTVAARILTRYGVSFKFVADRDLLYLINSKRWDRGGAGKFITAYPADTEQCGALLEELYNAMVGYSGPYILSDRRYKDSKVVYYRYGGFAQKKRLGVDGRPIYVIETDDGEFHDDERNAYFNLPPGVEDPFLQAEDDDGDDGGTTLKNGRYEIESVLAFSNSGGVYVAKDNETGETVVIKEARPFTNVTMQGTDSAWLLKKEHRLLTLLADTGVAPKPIDFFFDWEHAYLVQEKIEGEDLRGHLVMMSLSLRVEATQEDARTYYRNLCELFVKIAEAIHVLHQRRIVFSDLSHYNVLVLDEGKEIRLIDFEGAYEQGVDVASIVYTPGFASPKTLDQNTANQKDDCYTVGSLMMSALLPMNGLLVMRPQAYRAFLDAMIQDIALPRPIADCIARLMGQDEDARPEMPEVVEILKQGYEIATPRVASDEVDRVDLADVVDRTLDFCMSEAAFDRRDRLFPSDPEVYNTNPLGFAYGACGVAQVLQRVRGEVDPRVASWIADREFVASDMPPGLYMGLTGIAWTLLDLGLKDRAQELMAMTEDHHLLWRAPDVFHGAAGWGLGQLRFFLETGDEAYLHGARKAGKFLVDTAEEEDGLPYWRNTDFTSCSYAFGASGISTFLLYLSLADGDSSYLELGRRSLDWIESKSMDNLDGHPSWKAKEDEPTFTPYWEWGTAGIGHAVLRYLAVTGDPDLERYLYTLVPDCDRKYTIFPGYFFGLAGLADFHVEMARFGHQPQESIERARRGVAGTLLFAIESQRGGIAFPGESLTRLTCDFGTGGAGIAFAAHRLHTQGPPLLMLDELLDGHGRAPVVSREAELVAVP